MSSTALRVMTDPLRLKSSRRLCEATSWLACPMTQKPTGTYVRAYVCAHMHRYVSYYTVPPLWHCWLGCVLKVSAKLQ